MASTPRLEEAAHGVLAGARDIVAAAGENAQSMRTVGGLLVELAGSGALDDTIAASLGEKPAIVQVLAEDPDGSSLHLYLMDGWRSPPVSDAHWHNYWQALLVARGTWHDTVWRPVGAVVDGVAPLVAIDRREVVATGEVQVLGPDEPHGWRADERRRADGVVLLMWSGDAHGRPRMVLDTDTGAVTPEHGHLNPPGGPAA